MGAKPITINTKDSAKMTTSDFFKQGDIIVNAEIDRLNALRVQIGLKPISKRKNSKSNQMVRMMLSAKSILTSKTKQITL